MLGAKRVLYAVIKYVILLVLVVVISFALPRLLPGNPLDALAGEGSGYSGNTAASVLKSFEAYYAPELPVHEQFFRYVKNLAHFDLGISLFYKTPVLERIMSAARWTLPLSLISFAVGAVLGILLGVSMGLSKKNRGSLLVLPLLAWQAVPTFLVAALAQILLAYRLKWFPAVGAVTPGMLAGQPGYFADVLEHMALPLIILMIAEIPSNAVFAYHSTQKVKKAPYVAFAYYLNISRRNIRLHYIIKNILPDLWGRLNIQTVMCIMGSMFVEAVFSYPGLGSLLKNAASYRDYTMMQGILLVTCLYGIAVNLIYELVLGRFTRNS